MNIHKPHLVINNYYFLKNTFYFINCNLLQIILCSMITINHLNIDQIKKT